MNFLDKFTEIGMKIGQQRHMDALKNGLMATLPVTLVGSLFLIIRFAPIPGWTTLLENILGANYSNILLYPVAATFDMVGLTALVTISYHLAASYKVPPVAASVVAICGYFTLVPNFMMHNVANLNQAIRVDGVWSLEFTGAQSIFVVILSAIASVEIYRKIIQKGIVIKLPDMVPPNVADSFLAIVPMTVVLTVMWIFRIIIEITPFGSVHNMINTLIQTPLLNFGNTVWGYSTLIFFEHLFWTIGIHGPNMMGPLLEPLEVAFQQANRLAYEAGEALPYVFSKPFRDLFIHIGGSGNTFMFMIMCAFFARSQRLKTIGKLALGPAFFQINEPIIFGIPVVLNPIMMIPFILSSLAGLFIGYFATIWGWIPHLPGISIPWTTPLIINAFIGSNGSLAVVAAQIVTLGVTAVIYYPFFRIIDGQAMKEESGDIKASDISTDTTVTPEPVEQAK